MTTLNKTIVFNEPSISKLEIEAVTEVLNSGWLGTGKVCHQFEEEFAEYMGGGYAIALSSCTIGLQLALEVMFRDSIDVIVPALTFAATINAVINAGLNPILSDVDMSGCLDPTKLKINDRVGAIMPVHYSGTMANVAKIRTRAGKVPIIEDCAHAFGGKVDRLGDIQVFSFYPNKNITCGEGGMLLTKDKAVAECIRILASQGLSRGAWQRYGKGPVRDYSVEEVGFKANLPDVLAAIGLTQLRRWPELASKRRKVWAVYEKAFGKMPEGHSQHFYPLLVLNRTKVRQELSERGIGTGVHYKPLHLEPAYQYLGYDPGEFPFAEMWGAQEMSLPVSATMTEEDAQFVVEAIKDVIKGE